MTAAHKTRVADPGYNELSFLLGASGFSAAIAPGKFLDAARGVDKLLFAGEKGMTSGANADLNVLDAWSGCDTPRRMRTPYLSRSILDECPLSSSKGSAECIRCKAISASDEIGRSTVGCVAKDAVTQR